MFQKRKLGPGSYNIKDFIQLSNEKPRSGRGILDNLAPRFESKLSVSIKSVTQNSYCSVQIFLKRKLHVAWTVANLTKRELVHIFKFILIDNFSQSATPGPGTYGINGVPQKSLEIKDNKSTSTKGLLDAGDRKRSLPSVVSLFDNSMVVSHMLNI